jgi:hypothetical protein
MAVELFTPQVTVTLYKVVTRNSGISARASVAPRALDLTPYLGDAGAIRIVKNIRAPAGAFSLSIGDQVEPDVQDSLYTLIEAQDVVEIRGSRTPQAYSGGSLPVLMRGWVSKVSRNETMGQNGQPQRVVVITGQDSGKLLQIYQIMWEIAFIQDKLFLDLFNFQAITGLEATFQPVSQFMEQMITKVVNPKVDKLAPIQAGIFHDFSTAISVPTTGWVSPTLAGGYNGSIWGQMRQFADMPWNELFIQDLDAGPQLVFRPTPFYDDVGAGALIMAGAADPGTVAVDAAALVSINVARSDERVANFFPVPPGNGSFETSAFLSAAQLYNHQLIDLDYPNNDPVIYGVKKMEVGTQLIPGGQPFPPDVPGAARSAPLAAWTDWYTQRALDLKAMNRDNGVYEEGGMVLRGSEYLRPGQYLQLTRGKLVARYYMVGVSHVINPLGLWTTAVEVERGTGFIARLRYGGAPMWAEGRPGVYDTSAPSSPALGSASGGEAVG